MRFRTIVEDCPVITAVKDDEGLTLGLMAPSSIIFILYGDIVSIHDIVERIKNAGKIAMVHIDLIGGLSQKEVSVDYIKQNTSADGIISTRGNLIKRAKELSLYTIQRFFVIDSMAYESITNQCRANRPDCIEILPGVMPKVITRITESVTTPVIAGGLIADKDDIMQALGAGAVAVSSTNHEVWKM